MPRLGLLELTPFRKSQMAECSAPLVDLPSEQQ